MTHPFLDLAPFTAARFAAVERRLADLISDWLLDANLGDESEIETLIDDLTTFYITVRRGLVT